MSTVYWWQTLNIDHVLPYDYPPERINAARQNIQRNEQGLDKTIASLVGQCTSFEATVRRIARYVQQAVMHNPILQPATSRTLYTALRNLGVDFGPLALSPRFARLMRQRLIEDSELLIELGEARCGQCVALLRAALEVVGIKSKPLQLNNHVVNEVFWGGTSYIVDVDAFKNGIFVEGEIGLATKREVLDNPYLVDRFKPTGWMFRRDSIYGYNERTHRPYFGYIDLYSPEIDGQMSARYAAPTPLYPPGIPRWETFEKSITLTCNTPQTLRFTCVHAERATGYRVKCGLSSKGYSYDNLILENLANETSGEVFEMNTHAPFVEVKFAHPGIYYLTAAAIPHYAERYPSYIWWSDELKLNVV
jgi:hypothetical protein